MRPTLPLAHPYGTCPIDLPANAASLYETAKRIRAKAPRRPRGVEKAWWFHADRGHRKRHYWCCIASAYYCPFCGKLDWDQNDGCKPPKPQEKP